MVDNQNFITQSKSCLEICNSISKELGILETNEPVNYNKEKHKYRDISKSNFLAKELLHFILVCSVLVIGTVEVSEIEDHIKCSLQDMRLYLRAST